MVSSVFRRYTFLVVTICSILKAYSMDHFTAAIFEHSRQGDGTSDPPLDIIHNNLEFYERAAREAKEHAADIIIYPEYGLFLAINRSDLKPYVERIPNPKEERVNPCYEEELFSERPILHSLSCIAKENEIIVVANIGGIEECSNTSQCPDDGVLHHNANVVFDRNGTLLARYYKESLFFEFGMDSPTEEQDPVFETDIGRFATFICFDIVFKKIVSVSAGNDIDAVVFPTMWMNSSPFYTSTQWWQAWAMGNNMTLLAANLQNPGKLNVGSGIFVGREGPIVSTFSPDGISKLIISTVPKRGKQISPKFNIIAIKQNSTEIWDPNVESVPMRCSYTVLEPPQDVYRDYRCLNEQVTNYTLVKLNETEDHIKVCNNGMCCELEYVADNLTETFYFGVFNGTHNSLNRYFWSEENCFLARCEDVDGKPCSEFLMHSKTIFYRINMTANFTSKHIYPSFVESEMRLVPINEWTLESSEDKASIYFRNISGIQLLVSGLKGRVYERDPPYVR